jgi:UDP-glucuronate 4-epimerase
VPIREALRLIEQVTGRTLALEHLPAAPGDMLITRAATERLQRELHFLPATPLAEGLRRQWEWIAARGGRSK